MLLSGRQYWAKDLLSVENFVQDNLSGTQILFGEFGTF